MNSFVKVLRSDFFNRYGMLIILVLLILFMGGMSGGRFFRPQNLLNILEQVTPVGIIAIGVTFVIITGGIDLSLGSVIALAGVSAALVAQGQGPAMGHLGPSGRHSRGFALRFAQWSDCSFWQDPTVHRDFGHDDGSARHGCCHF